MVPSTFEENLEKASFKNGAAYAQATAMAKAQEVASRDWPQHSLPSLVIGADTVVEQDGCILEKPADASDAHDMLSRSAVICSSSMCKWEECYSTPSVQKSQKLSKCLQTLLCRLSARRHQVHTGVALIVPSNAGGPLL